jgi:hypothetical protein
VTSPVGNFSFPLLLLFAAFLCSRALLLVMCEHDADDIHLVFPNQPYQLSRGGFELALVVFKVDSQFPPTHCTMARRQHSVSSSLALVGAATALSTCWSQSSTHLRGGSAHSTFPADFNESSSVLCRVTIMDTLYLSATNVSSTTEQPTCIPIVDGMETELDFAIELPMELYQEHRAEIAFMEPSYGRTSFY